MRLNACVSANERKQSTALSADSTSSGWDKKLGCILGESNGDADRNCTLPRLDGRSWQAVIVNAENASSVRKMDLGRTLLSFDVQGLSNARRLLSVLSACQK